MGVHFTRQAVCRAAAAAAWHRLPRLAYPAAACFMRPASLLLPRPVRFLPSGRRTGCRLVLSGHALTLGLPFSHMPRPSAFLSSGRLSPAFFFAPAAKGLYPAFQSNRKICRPWIHSTMLCRRGAFFAGFRLMRRGDGDRKSKPPAYTPAAGTNTKTPGQMPGGQSHNRLIGRRFFCYTSSIMAISAASPRRTPVLMMRV